MPRSTELHHGVSGAFGPNPNSIGDVIERLSCMQEKFPATSITTCILFGLTTGMCVCVCVGFLVGFVV